MEHALDRGLCRLLYGKLGSNLLCYQACVDTGMVAGSNMARLIHGYTTMACATFRNPQHYCSIAHQIKQTAPHQVK